MREINIQQTKAIVTKAVDYSQLFVNVKTLLDFHHCWTTHQFFFGKLRFLLPNIHTNKNNHDQKNDLQLV